jgi:hypothetical protein
MPENFFSSGGSPTCVITLIRDSEKTVIGALLRAPLVYHRKGGSQAELMSANFSGGLIGLSLLTGNGSLLSLYSQGAPESRAVRLAKAQFTAPRSPAPWQQPPSTLPLPTQVSNIMRMPSIVDVLSARDRTLPADVQTTFTAYKALDRLRLLAESAAKTGTSATERASLGLAFNKGMADLQSFLAAAPTDKVGLSFAQPARRSESAKLPTQPVEMKTLGKGLLASRYAAIPGLTGAELLKITLTKNGQSESVTVDLGQTPQPPTLDSVAAAFNAAIMAIPQRSLDGTVLLDASGNPVPKYAARFAADKGSGSWGLALDAPSFEKIAIDQVGAKDALMVASGSTALDAPTATRILRFDDPAGVFERRTLGTISALDRDATERAALNPPPKLPDGTTPAPPQVWAQTSVRAIASDGEGNSYVIGTTAGDLGSNLATGNDDLFLTKLNSEGKVIWQRTLGASGSAAGAAIAVAANGDVIVAGTVTGPFDGSIGSDSDMVVVRFNGDGDEKFATAIRSIGNEEATAIAIGADGAIFVGGKASSGAGDAFIARIGATGGLQERTLIDSGGSDGVTALAIDGSGELLALTREGATAQLRRIDAQALATGLGSITIGTADARAIAVSSTGEIAIVGATRTALSGAQVNGVSGGRDGFVARIDAALSAASVTYLGTGAEDEVDSVAYLNGALYVGGRTTGALSGTRQGAVDGFVGRIDAASGAIETVNQFGQAAMRTEAVRLAAAAGGAGVTGALGFHRGTLNPDVSASLVSQTSLRAGDEFTLRINGGAARKIIIQATDTLETLAERVRHITALKATVSTPRIGDTRTLRIEAREGHTIDLVAGAAGKDALAKLGIEPARLASPVPRETNAPRVQPGGAFGLGLTGALGIGTAADAAIALKSVKDGMSMTQTAYRSLYWDSTKAALVNGRAASGGGTPYQQAQLARYQDALVRISAITGFSSGEMM